MALNSFVMALHALNFSFSNVIVGYHLYVYLVNVIFSLGGTQLLAFELNSCLGLALLLLIL